MVCTLAQIGKDIPEIFLLLQHLEKHTIDSIHFGMPSQNSIKEKTDEKCKLTTKYQWINIAYEVHKHDKKRIAKRKKRNK